MAGITGSILAFYIEIDEWLHPELVLTEQDLQLQPQSYQRIFSALMSAHPQRTLSWRLELPDNPKRMITARYYQPKEKAGLAFAPLQVWVNPYTAEVINSRFWGDYAMTWIYDLHFTLLMDKTGRNIVAFIGLCVFVSLLTGLYLWWPTKKAVKTAFSFKLQASIQRNIYDVHKLTGVYGAIILLLIVITGTLLDFSETKKVIEEFSPLYQAQNTQSTIVDSATRIHVDEAVVIAQALFPTAKVKWIVTPNDEWDSYRINLRQVGEPSLRFPKTNVWIDQYSGEVLSIRDVRDDSAGDTLLRWLHPLHSGEAFGLAGRVVVFLVGLLPLVLFITGVIRWRQKKQASKS
jgi:uncharacterized iron-regulated membrane protein